MLTSCQGISPRSRSTVPTLIQRLLAVFPWVLGPGLPVGNGPVSPGSAPVGSLKTLGMMRRIADLAAGMPQNCPFNESEDMLASDQN